MFRRYLMNKPALSIAIIVLCFGFIFCNEAVISDSATGCVVKNKIHIGSKNKGNTIYTEGCNGSSEGKTFSVKNNWFAGQFAAGDTYDQIEIGKTYDFVTRGITNPLLQTGGNIVEAKEASR
jgi:hypothetical protein